MYKLLIDFDIINKKFQATIEPVSSFLLSASATESGAPSAPSALLIVI